jgi:uncharacterized membrane protein YphA (DoxX/SURF4 family)
MLLKNFANAPLRPWIAPALGAGLLLAGVAMALGVSSAYGPMIAAAIALVSLLIGHWRTSKTDAVRARKAAR